MNERMHSMTQEIIQLAEGEIDESAFLDDELTPVASPDSGVLDMEQFRIRVGNMGLEKLISQVSYYSKLVIEFDAEIPMEGPQTLWDKERGRLKSIAQAKLRIANKQLKIAEDLNS